MTLSIRVRVALILFIEVKRSLTFSLALYLVSMADEAIDNCRAGSFFPKASLTQDGWSTKEEATSTCYCGAVQLCFVSPQNVLIVAYISSLPATIQARLHFLLCLPLQRLPQNHSIHVYLGICRPRYASETCSWGGTSQSIQSIGND
jgi:hypothetical protein